jgi:hypothetical protein
LLMHAVLVLKWKVLQHCNLIILSLPRHDSLPPTFLFQYCTCDLYSHTWVLYCFLCQYLHSAHSIAAF